MIFLGGADNSLRSIKWGCHGAPNAKPLDGTDILGVLSSPVLSLVVSSGDIVGCGCMDGSVWLFSKVGDDGVWKGNKCEKSHGKRVTCLSFNVDRRSRVGGDSSSSLLLASSSSDGTVHVHSVSADVEGEVSSALSRVIRTGSSPVETLTFSSLTTLVLYVRDEHFLRFYEDVGTREGSDFSRVTMNGSDRAFDDHVSFAVLSIQSNHDDSLLLCATDKHRNIIIENNAHGEYGNGGGEGREGLNRTGD